MRHHGSLLKNTQKSTAAGHGERSEMSLRCGACDKVLCMHKVMTPSPIISGCSKFLLFNFTLMAVALMCMAY